MEKIFSNKKFAYIVIGILIALQLTQSIANWCGGGFNGGSLILCILMVGLLTLVGVGIGKNNKLLTIISGVAILSVVIYILVSSYSGMIQNYVNGIAPASAVIGAAFSSAATLLFIGCLVLVILKAFGINKNLKTIATVFSIVAALLLLAAAIIPFATGFLTNPDIVIYSKVKLISRDFIALFIALLIPCVWQQLDKKE